jgi:hypothetical protein
VIPICHSSNKALDQILLHFIVSVTTKVLFHHNEIAAKFPKLKQQERLKLYPIGIGSTLSCCQPIYAED